MGKWIFDDVASLLHILLGVVAAKSEKQGKDIIGVYTLYQLAEREPMINKLGDFMEFGIGYAVGKEI